MPLSRLTPQIMRPEESPGSELAWISLLAPAHPGELRPASGPDILRLARLHAGDQAVAWVVEVGHLMAERIIVEMPVFGGGGEAFDILRMGTESSTLQFLVRLIDGDSRPAATEEALDGVLDFVRRGIGLESVLRGTRLGHRVMSEAFLAAGEELGDPMTRVEDMKLVTTKLFDFMDSFSAALAGRYLEEQVRWSASDNAAQLELVEEILAGAEPAVPDAYRTLRYDLSGTHIAVIAWSSDPRTDVDSVELQEACLQLLARLGAVRRLMIPVGAGRVWAWGEMPKEPMDAVTLIAVTRLPAGSHLVCGSPSAGIRGFRASHSEAAAVQRLLPGAATAAVAYEQVDMVSLLLEDRARAIEFAARELRSLSVDSPGNRDLRHTLEVFLDEQGSTQATAQRLIVARNTVSYRIRRVEEIMGRSIRDRLPRLRLALMIAHVLPEEVGNAAQR